MAPHGHPKEDPMTEFQLAVDPGGTTGLAWIVEGVFDSGQLAGGRFAFTTYFTWAKEMHPSVIICEDFIISNATARKTPQPDPWRILGFLELWCDMTKTAFVSYTPSEAKGFGTDAKLKHLGWYKPGKPHANDAARHLLYFNRNRPWVHTKLLEMS
jgi:hypothetical protein